MFCCVVNVCYY